MLDVGRLPGPFGAEIEDDKPMGLAEAGRVWHTDLSYMAAPGRCSLLHALEVPQDDAGQPLGDTMFASARLAYLAYALG